MSFVIDKKSVWEATLEAYDGAPSSGPMFHTLWNECYLDSVEDGVATVCLSSDTMRRVFQRQAQYDIRKALEEVLGYPVRVKAVVASPRLFVPPAAPSTQDAYEKPGIDAEKHELMMLHERYGDIMGIVDNHPIFKKAALPLDRGGWSIWPQKLTTHCKEYGVLAVLNCLRFIANKPSIRNPRGFFFEVMAKGQFGHKLTITPSLTGPAKEAVVS